MAFEVDYFTLSVPEATNQYVTLSGTPTDSSNVAMDLIGGTAQLLKAVKGDFGVTANTVRWDSTIFNLNGVLTIGDKIRVIYDRS